MVKIEVDLRRNMLEIYLKIYSAILIQYTFDQIEQIAPHSPLAVCFVCALKKTLELVHSPGFVNE